MTDVVSATTPAAPTTVQTVLISAGVTLLVGLLSLLGALLVEHLRRRSTDRRWLLDRRHDAYVEFLSQSGAVRRAFGHERAWNNLAPSERQQRMGHLEEAYISAVLMASDRTLAPVRQLYSAVFTAVQETAEGDQRAAAIALMLRHTRELVTAIREEVQPGAETPWPNPEGGV